MNLEIRQARSDELPAILRAMSTAFLEIVDPDKVAEEVGGLWDLSRAWATFDGDGVCGTFRSWATEMTVPGGAQLPGTAVSAVTVLPTHRRRGILRRMAAAEHAAARERGEAVALLYSAEYPIYGRFGYGAACQQATWTLDAHGTSFAGPPVEGMEIVKPDAEARDLIVGVFEEWRGRQPGEIRRNPYRWDYDLALRSSAWGPDWKGFLAIHRNASGSADGYVRYHADDKWERGQPRVGVVVDELHALDERAYVTLWRFLAETDWIATVKAERRRPGERLRWFLANARAATLSDVFDGLWVRLFDVARCLEARTYERSATIVLEVVDGEATGGRTRFELDASPEGVACHVTDRAPELTVSVAALGAAYLGGTSLRDAVLLDGADEHREGALGEADALFRTLDEPWCSTFF